MTDNISHLPARTDDDDLVNLAYPYALDAVDDVERSEIDARRAAADDDTREEFDAALQDIHETMAFAATAATAVPPVGLGARILDAIGSIPQDDPVGESLYEDPSETSPERSRWLLFAAPAAAALIIAAGAVGVTRLTETPTTPESAQVLAAPDHTSQTANVFGGGAATLTYSPSMDAAVIRLDNVPPPAARTVYQMWLMVKGTPQSVGTISDADMAGDHARMLTGVGVGTALAITVEPVGGSEQPTTTPIVDLPMQA